MQVWAKQNGPCMTRVIARNLYYIKYKCNIEVVLKPENEQWTRVEGLL